MKIGSSKLLLWFVGLTTLVLGVALMILLCVKRDNLTYAKPVLQLGVDVVFKYPLLFAIMILCFLFLIFNIAGVFYAMMGIYTFGTREDNPLDGRPYPKYSLNIWKFLLMGFFPFRNILAC